MTLLMTLKYLKTVIEVFIFTIKSNSSYIITKVSDSRVYWKRVIRKANVSFS